MTCTIDIAPLSAGTLPGLWHAAKQVASAEDWAEQAPSETGVITFRCTTYTGRSLLDEDPTVSVTASTFKPTQLFRVASSIHGILECWASERSIIGCEHSPLIVVNLMAACAEPAALFGDTLSSTDPTAGISRLVGSKFVEAVASAEQEWFEDGVESQFFRTLSALVHAYGDVAVATMETFLGSPVSNTEVAVEAAQWLGEVDHPTSYQYRRTLLEKVLLSAPSTRLRHGAAAGLAALDDPSSLPVVREALQRETNRRLRHFLQLVVDQLERTRACRSS
jgi:hypothetical protein